MEALIYALREDMRICESLDHAAEILLPPPEEPAIQRYAELDCKLCMIAERKKIIEVEDVLRDEYPVFYEKIKDFIAILKDETSAASQKARLLPQYAKTSQIISGGRFFELYPEEKNRAYGTVIASGDTPYERSHKKIGRNDPCPCGSGKKYKKCCMGKI